MNEDPLQLIRDDVARAARGAVVDHFCREIGVERGSELHLAIRASEIATQAVVEAVERAARAEIEDGE